MTSKLILKEVQKVFKLKGLTEPDVYLGVNMSWSKQENGTTQHHHTLSGNAITTW